MLQGQKSTGEERRCTRPGPRGRTIRLLLHKDRLGTGGNILMIRSKGKPCPEQVKIPAGMHFCLLLGAVINPPPTCQADLFYCWHFRIQYCQNFDGPAWERESPIYMVCEWLSSLPTHVQCTGIGWLKRTWSASSGQVTSWPVCWGSIPWWVLSSRH